MIKQRQPEPLMQMHLSTDIHDLWASHAFLAPNEYSPEVIGIQNCLLRCQENEHFGKFFYHGIKTNVETKDFIAFLNVCYNVVGENTLVDIERCMIIARLRRYLEENKLLFPHILNRIQQYVHQCMLENPPIPSPQTLLDLNRQCDKQNQCAITLDQAYRMRRFQFYADDDVQKSINLIDLQSWILSHLQLFITHIPKQNLRDSLIPRLKTLLNNSFFIIRHPSPPIATHTPANKEPITAKIHCQILCLLDISNYPVTIESIIPRVRLLTTSNHSEEDSIVYDQPPLTWQNYTITTAANKPRNFLYAELSEIILRKHSATVENQKSSKLKLHYAPYTYCIEFDIRIKVRIPNELQPIQHSLIVQSAPFGLITNTSQEADLFSKVFIHDLKSWKPQIIPIEPGSTLLNPAPPQLITTDVTVDEIVNSIRRYFIHQTGIVPKVWVMQYIEQLLRVATNNSSSAIENLCYNVLSKILAQINFIAKHPVLSLFHHDGLFLAICDSEKVHQILCQAYECNKVPICAIRLSEIRRMLTPKDIGVRVNVIDKALINARNCTFDGTKLPFALGIFIIKIITGEASRFENLLTTANTDDSNVLNKTINYAKSYDSEKLRQICPHRERYPSIWYCPHNEENNCSTDFDASLTNGLSPMNSITTVTGSGNINNIIQNTNTVNIDTNDPMFMSNIELTSALQPYNSQSQNYPPLEHPLQAIPSSSAPSFPIPQINQTNLYQSPVVIIVTDGNNGTMSNHDVLHLISNQLPQCAPLMQSSFIYRICTNQTFIPPTPLHEKSSHHFNNLNNNTPK